MRIAQVSKVEQNIVFFIVGNILGRERSTFSRIMRLAQFLYVEIQPQGCDNNPETSQFLIFFFLSKTFTLFISGHLFIISAQLWTLVSFCSFAIWPQPMKNIHFLKSIQDYFFCSEASSKIFFFRESSSSRVAATHIIVQLLQPSRCPV